MQETLAKANKDIEPEVKEILRLFALKVEQAKEAGEDVPDIDSVKMPTPNMAQYGLENIVARLKSWSREGTINRDSILALPSAHYQVLHWEGLKIDNAEQARATGFLVTRLSVSTQAELALISGNSETSHQVGLEQPAT